MIAAGKTVSRDPYHPGVAHDEFRAFEDEILYAKPIASINRSRCHRAIRHQPARTVKLSQQRTHFSVLSTTGSRFARIALVTFSSHGKSTSSTCRTETAEPAAPDLSGCGDLALNLQTPCPRECLRP